MIAAGAKPVVEAHGVYGSNLQRADLWLSSGFTQRSISAAVDVTIVEPRSRSALPNAASIPLLTSKNAEKDKRRKYLSGAQARGSSFHCWSMESSGAWGPGASAIFRSLGSLAASHRKPLASFKRFWSSAIASAFARAQAEFLLSSAASRSQRSVFRAPPDPTNAQWSDALRVRSDIMI